MGPSAWVFVLAGRMVRRCQLACGVVLWWLAVIPLWAADAKWPARASVQGCSCGATRLSSVDFVKHMTSGHVAVTPRHSCGRSPGHVYKLHWRSTFPCIPGERKEDIQVLMMIREDFCQGLQR